MMLKVVNTDAGAGLSAEEITLVARGVERYGRAVLLVPNRSERDICRRALADGGCLCGVEVATPATWIEGLAQLLGDGRTICSALERQLIMASVVADRSADELAPLRDNPGTVRMLSRMARDLLPYAVADGASYPEGDSWSVVASLLAAYSHALEGRGLIEASAAADLVAAELERGPVACARCVIVRDVTTLPRYLVRLLAAVAKAGDVAVLLRNHQGAQADALAKAFAGEGCICSSGVLGEAAPAPCACAPSFLEVGGPHARLRAYADELVRLMGDACPEGDAARAVVAAPRPAELFDGLAPYLSARGVSCRATRYARFEDTLVGRQFLALADLVRRMRAAQEGAVNDTEWWPAPELTDWLYAPISGVDAGYARAFDKKVRSNRALGVAGVLREVQSVQSRAAAQRRKAAPDAPFKQVPVVCSDVVQFLMQDRPVSALKSMLAAVVALPASAFGSADGEVRQAAERTIAERAIEMLMEDARRLGVSQAVAVSALEGLCATVRCRSRAAREKADGPVPAVTFMTLADAALLEPGEIDVLLMADVDVSGYPLSHEEGPVPALADALGCPACELEPAARLRDLAARSLAAPRAATLARVTHDRQAKDRYPAAIWTELRAAAGEDAPRPRQVGEGDIEGDFDPVGPGAARRERVACLPPQSLDGKAAAYLVPRALDESGALVPRQLSASQIESYADCPLCWFMSYRVRPNTIDAGFSNMEKGNFVHDVMDRFHERLIELGMRRVTTENLPRSLAELRRVFDEVRAEHERGKTASSAALVPLSATERRQVDDILPQLEKVVRYEAAALAPFAPAYLEYSFNGLGASYAGWPLGGRIDRVDVDAEGRAVVIDYKHRSDAAPYRLKDPTVPNVKTGEVPADDPRWLPEHTQSLIYAQALRRTLGLDVRGALYFSTKGRVAMRGAVSAELAEVEPGDGRVPGLRDGFPAAEAGGTMDFEGLLDRVEAGIAERLDELSAGCVAAAETPRTSCVHNHPLGFTRRDA